MKSFISNLERWQKVMVVRELIEELRPIHDRWWEVRKEWLAMDKYDPEREKKLELEMATLSKDAYAFEYLTKASLTL